jgi:teichuronic acid exporter
MDLRKKVLLGLGWSAGARFTGQLITWIITIIVMRLLTPGDYGLMAMAGVFIVFLALLNELGLGAALIQRQEIDETTLRQIFGMLWVINSCLFLILLLIAPLIGSFFNEQRVVPIIRLLSIQFIMMPFAIIPQSLLTREMNFKGISIVDFVSAIAGSLITLMLALNGFGVWSLVWGSMGIIVSRTIGLNVISSYLHIPTFSFKGMAQTITFGGYVTISRILWGFYTQADTFIIGKLLGKDLLGFYSVGMTIATLPMDKVSGIINQVAFPAFSSIQTEPQQVTAHFLKAVRVMSFLAFPILWGMSSIAPELVAVLLGDKWKLAVVPFQLLSLVIPIRMISNLMAPAVMGLGRPDISFYNVLLASLVMPICILVATHWGIVGVSVAWILVFPLIFLRNLSQVVTVLRIRSLEVLLAMTRPALAAAVMYLIIIIIKMLFRTGANSISNLILLITVGIMVYGGLIIGMNRQGYREVIGLMLQK